MGVAGVGVWVGVGLGGTKMRVLCLCHRCFSPELATNASKYVRNSLNY